MQAWHLGNEKPSARPMGGAGILVICLAYVFIFGVHAGAVVVVMDTLGLNLLAMEP